jgi:acyl-CoA reductase-like NAD-dependent aldehyde dehydrogenase
VSHHNTFIGGVWRRASGSAELDVIDSFTEQPFALPPEFHPRRQCRRRKCKAALSAWSARAPAERIAFIRLAEIAKRTDARYKIAPALQGR